MEEIIKAKLNEIEEREGVRIIHAVESGSRAWGFASPDSDYDVRFIYVRPKEFYLRLEKTRDVMECLLDETLDINGWDLQKALRLLQTSNPTLFEWNNSPIIYKTTANWKKIQTEINGFFTAKSGLYHYLSTATSNYREYLKTDMVKLKKYFYVLRPLLACKWILDKRCPPPMLFSDLVEAELEADMKPIIDDLLIQKMNTPEMGNAPRIDVLPQRPSSNWSRLNELFLNEIFES
ncbi:MAG: nucleotidyltransferase domain-containing protein [Saccharofermentanales bacterium]